MRWASYHDTSSVGWLQRGLRCPDTKKEGANLHRKSKNIYHNVNTKNSPLAEALCSQSELGFDTSSYTRETKQKKWGIKKQIIQEIKKETN